MKLFNRNIVKETRKVAKEIAGVEFLNYLDADSDKERQKRVNMFKDSQNHNSITLTEGK